MADKDSKGGKRYVVAHMGISNPGFRKEGATNAKLAHQQGDVITESDVAAGDLPRLIQLGAVREATDEELAQWDAAHDLPAGTQDKAAALAPDSPALTTGQIGGAPLDSVAAQTPAPSDGSAQDGTAGSNATPTADDSKSKK